MQTAFTTLLDTTPSYVSSEQKIRLLLLWWIRGNCPKWPEHCDSLPKKKKSQSYQPAFVTMCFTLSSNYLCYIKYMILAEMVKPSSLHFYSHDDTKISNTTQDERHSWRAYHMNRKRGREEKAVLSEEVCRYQTLSNPSELDQMSMAWLLISWEYKKKAVTQKKSTGKKWEKVGNVLSTIASWWIGPSSLGASVCNKASAHYWGTAWF